MQFLLAVLLRFHCLNGVAAACRKVQTSIVATMWDTEASLGTSFSSLNFKQMARYCSTSLASCLRLALVRAVLIVMPWPAEASQVTLLSTPQACWAGNAQPLVQRMIDLGEPLVPSVLHHSQLQRHTYAMLCSAEYNAALESVVGPLRLRSNQSQPERHCVRLHLIHTSASAVQTRIATECPGCTDRTNECACVQLRYANNSNYKNDTMIRKEVYVSTAVLDELERVIAEAGILQARIPNLPL